MLKWFRESAPIRLKLKIAFGFQTALVALAGSVVLLAGYGFCTPTAGALCAAECLFLSAFLGLMMAPAISEPYVTTVVRMEGLAAGDIDSPIEHTHYRDCVGRLAVAMTSFREAAVAKQQAEATAEEQRARAEEQRSRADGDHSRREAEKAEHAAHLDLAISSIAAGLAQLAEGNFAFRIETPLHDDADRLRVDFNASMQKMQQTMQAVGANAQAIRSGSKEISGAADELARRTEKQAANLEETAAALAGITVTVRKTAEGALRARQVVTTAKGDAESSGAVANDAVQAMNGIASSSRQINQIIGVIDEIAFQTNLLALNAGVEAARAGDAGRGFAVVASEVRALAQRSAEAAKEIKSLISNSTTHVDRGVDLVVETGRALTRIVAHVSEISDVVTEIAASAQEQSISLQEVNTAVGQMDQMTQQNAAMVEESTAASHAMMQETEGLIEMLGRIKTGADAGNIVNFKIAKPPQKPSVARTQTYAAASHGSPVPKRQPAMATADEGWEEF